MAFHPRGRIEGAHPAEARAMNHEDKEQPHEAKAQQLRPDKHQHRAVQRRIQQPLAVQEEQDRQQRDATGRKQGNAWRPFVAPVLVVGRTVGTPTPVFTGRDRVRMTISTPARDPHLVQLAMVALRGQGRPRPEPGAEPQQCCRDCKKKWPQQRIGLVAREFHA
ncbi:MAG: hypothetical protein ACK55I_36990, partial [bacterium]